MSSSKEDAAQIYGRGAQHRSALLRRLRVPDLEVVEIAVLAGAAEFNTALGRMSNSPTRSVTSTGVTDGPPGASGWFDKPWFVCLLQFL